MKKNLLLNAFQVMLLLLGLTAAGCQGDPAGGAEAFLRPDRALSITVTVAPPDDPHTTKSAFAGAPDAVKNYNLLVYTDGVLAAKYYREGSGELVLRVGAGTVCDYYCVANAGDVTGGFQVGVSRENELEGWTLTTSVAGAEALPMAWSARNLSYSRAELLSGTRLPVKLKRLVAQYDIVIDRSGLQRYAFTATSLSLCGPAAVKPFAESKATSSAVRTDYAVQADLAALNRGGATHYYPLENRWGVLLPGNTDPWAKVPGNLPSGAQPSYIELSGQVILTDGSAVTFPVTYRFYLGADAVSDFDVVRNRVYTVTLTLSDAAIERQEPSWKVEKGSYVEHYLVVTPETATIDADGDCWFSAEWVTVVNGRETTREDVSFASDWSVDDALAAVTETSGSFKVTGSNTTDRAVSGAVWAVFRRDGERYEASAELTVRAPFRPYLETNVEELTWDYDESGGAFLQGITVSANVSWKAEFEAGASDYSMTSSSGSGTGSFMVAPVRDNETAESVTGRIRIYNAEYGLECFVDLEQLPYFRRKHIWPIYYSLSLEPEEADIAADGVQSYVATLYCYRDAARTDCFFQESRLTTYLAFWTSSNPSAAVMRDEYGRETVGGYMSSFAHGVNTRHGNSYLETTITVTPLWDGVDCASALLRVADIPDIPVVTLYRLEVTVTPESIECDGTAQAQAWLQKSTDDGATWTTVEEVTSQAAWVSSDTDVATVGPDGTVTGCYQGSTATTVRITGTYAGVTPSVSDYADLEVAGKDPGPGPGPGPDPDPVLIALTFDREHYDLVWVADGQVHTSTPFVLTACYDNDSTSVVTVDAEYADMGCLALDAAGGLLEATSACSAKTLTASYGDLTATATYSAEDLEVPAGLTGLHLESQDNAALEFIVDGIDAVLECVLSGNSRIEDVTADLDVSTEAPVVSDGYRSDRGWLFHFTAPGSGAVTFTYRYAGIAVQWRILVTCDASHHVTYISGKSATFAAQSEILWDQQNGLPALSAGRRGDRSGP